MTTFEKISINSSSLINNSIDLDIPIKNYLYCDIVNFVCPFSFYAIYSGNNTLRFVETSGPTNHDITISEGNYSATELASAIQTAINLVFPGFTITFSEITQRFTFSNASSFNISNSAVYSTMYNVIGQPSITPGTSTTSTKNALLTRTNNIYIKSENLSTKNTYLNNQLKKYIGSIPVNVNPGEFIFYSNIFEILPEKRLSQLTTNDLYTIDLELFDDNDVAIDLNGNYFTLDIYCWHKTGDK